MLTRKAIGYGKIQSRAIKGTLNYPFIAVISHWTFQSLFYVDRTERWFKLSLDLGLTVLLSLPLHHWLAAFLLAHSLNFFFNGQLWGVLKHYGLVHWAYDDFNAYVDELAQRARRESSIQSLYVYGSLARGEWNDRSDLDARLLRKPGLVNGLRSCLFLLAERTRALIKRFPLDLYVLDNDNPSARLCTAEKSSDLLAQDRLWS
jgi:predicted nucleotidyltransferase